MGDETMTDKPQPQTTEADAEVIDITATIKHNRSVEIFARLWGLAEKNAEEVKRNPDAFLRRAYEHVGRMDRFFEELKMAAWPTIKPFNPREPLEHPMADMNRRLAAVSELLMRGPRNATEATDVK